MTTAQILATAGTTKTWKMQQLFALGHSRQQVAALLGVGYGFAQNVYAAWRAAGPAAAPRALVTPVAFAPGAFSRTFGVEIEGYGVSRATLLAELRAQGLDAEEEGYNHSTRPHWKIVSDASIQGADGFELVSPVLRGLEGLADLERACRALTNCRAQINASCGLHVHIGARELSVEHLRRLVRNYLVLEPTIDELMPAGRRADNNPYCRGLRRGRSLAEAERALLAATTAEQLATAANGESRYHKVNLQSFFRHGTVEFRQHSGSTEYEKISFWVKFLHNLVDFSAQHLVTPSLPVTEFSSFNQRDIATYYQRRRTALATR